MLYRLDERLAPAGLFVMDVGLGQAILWDHRSRVWAYDPDLVARFVNGHRNFDRYETVDRSAAEGVAEIVTSGGSLPDEEAIRAIFTAAGGGSPRSPSDAR
ncbi:hypothetical protein [Micromonospora sp. U21]|uniref:hypothetical protein n=1 Tax=Micromonospora sp. U21 TaxID=2824899 RepID=UPI001B3818CA|nr:hypothetical protein [Micromonospora sp. U21]MBQ0903046.1 hypothetical protein [Micromonospora sp. U21]